MPGETRRKFGERFGIHGAIQLPIREHLVVFEEAEFYLCIRIDLLQRLNNWTLQILSPLGVFLDVADAVND